MFLVHSNFFDLSKVVYSQHSSLFLACFTFFLFFRSIDYAVSISLQLLIYLPNSLGQETVKWLLCQGLWVKLQCIKYSTGILLFCYSFTNLYSRFLKELLELMLNTQLVNLLGIFLGYQLLKICLVIYFVFYLI